MPILVNAEVRAAMPRSALLAYLASCEAADLDGCFTMPAGQLAQVIGKHGRKAAWRAMSPLLAAGLVRVVHEGGRGAATIYGLAPLRNLEPAKVIQLFQQRAHQAREYIAAGFKAPSEEAAVSAQ